MEPKILLLIGMGLALLIGMPAAKLSAYDKNKRPFRVGGKRGVLQIGKFRIEKATIGQFETYRDVKKYVCNQRMAFAQALIKNGESSVTEISRMCGYSDPLYFSKVYSKECGTSPREAIKKNREKNL